MEAIDKAQVAEFAAKVKAQAEANIKNINELQANVLRMQGATAAMDYVMALDTIEVGDEDEVTDEDAEHAAKWLAEQDLDEASQYEVEVGPEGTFGDDYTDLSVN